MLVFRGVISCFLRGIFSFASSKSKQIPRGGIPPPFFSTNRPPGNDGPERNGLSQSFRTCGVLAGCDLNERTFRAPKDLSFGVGVEPEPYLNPKKRIGRLFSGEQK